MFSFFSSFKSDVRQAIAAIHDRFVTLETKIEALISHAKETPPNAAGDVTTVSAPPATSAEPVTTPTSETTTKAE